MSDSLSLFRKGKILALASALFLSACGSSSSGSNGTSETGNLSGDGQPQHVVISEINYHDVSDSDANDFVELFNNYDEDVALTGWCIKGVGFCFTATTVIKPGEFVVVKGSEFDGRLGNKGERIRLTDAQDNIRDEVTYADSPPWPKSADGDGDSLHRVNTQQPADSAEDWVAAPPTPGEPLPEGIQTSAARNDAVRSVAKSEVVMSRVFKDAAHTRSPASSAVTEVVAYDREAAAVNMYYVYNFDAEVVVAMRDAGNGLWRGEIPGTSENSLIRYRLTRIIGDVETTWPGAANESTYDGTVAQSANTSNIVRLQWFMNEENFALLRAKRDLDGDTGFPAIFAIDGEIIDNALIRVKGQESRGRNKNKYKVTLPEGTSWDFAGLLDESVNEFGLHSMLTDKSFSRELLTYELQKVAGGMAQEVFPVRLELNGDFYGLFLYHEQPDSRWRGEYGFNEDTVVIKGERISTLRLGHTYRTDAEMNVDYRKLNQDGEVNHKEMRWLIEQVNQPKKKQLIDFAYKHIDIPQVVNALAVARVAQHVELEHKNWMMFYDLRDEKWRFQAIDHDLNFGKKWTAGCKSRCDEVFANPYMNYMEANRFARIFIRIPDFREMLDRRTRTLADLFLVEGVIEQKLSGFLQLMESVADLDIETWGQYGEPQTMKVAQDLIVTNYAQPKRGYYFRSDNKYLPPSQSQSISYTLSSASEVQITSTDDVAIDISGVELPSLSATVPPGTVLLPGQSVVFATVRTPHTYFASRNLHVFVES